MAWCGLDIVKLAKPRQQVWIRGFWGEHFFTGKLHHWVPPWKNPSNDISCMSIDLSIQTQHLHQKMVLEAFLVVCSLLPCCFSVGLVKIPQVGNPVPLLGLCSCMLVCTHTNDGTTAIENGYSLRQYWWWRWRRTSSSSSCCCSSHKLLEALQANPSLPPISLSKMEELGMGSFQTSAINFTSTYPMIEKGWTGCWQWG